MGVTVKLNSECAWLVKACSNDMVVEEIDVPVGVVKEEMERILDRMERSIEAVVQEKTVDAVTMFLEGLEMDIVGLGEEPSRPMIGICSPEDHSAVIEVPFKDLVATLDPADPDELRGLIAMRDLVVARIEGSK